MKKNKHMETTIQPDAAVKQTQEAKPEPTHIDGLPVKVEDGGKFFELNEFDGASKGFKFYVMQFKTLEDAIEHYKALKQDDAILTLVNRQLNFNMRTKAKNQITNEDVAKKLLSRGETLLINVDEARQFVPGEREVTSVGGLYKAIDALKDQVKEAREAGDPELASSLKEKIKVLYAKLQEKVLAGLEDE